MIDAVERGRRAQAILDDPLVVDAREKLKAEILAAWIGAPARDASGREALWQMMKLSERFFAHLTALVQTGKLSDPLLLERERRLADDGLGQP